MSNPRIGPSQQQVRTAWSEPEACSVFAIAVFILWSSRNLRSMRVTKCETACLLPCLPLIGGLRTLGSTPSDNFISYLGPQLTRYDLLPALPTCRDPFNHILQSKRLTFFNIFCLIGYNGTQRRVIKSSFLSVCFCRHILVPPIDLLSYQHTRSRR